MNSTEEGHICRPPFGEPRDLSFFLCIALEEPGSRGRQVGGAPFSTPGKSAAGGGVASPCLLMHEQEGG